MERTLLIAVIENTSEVCIYICQKLKLEIKALVTVCHQYDNIFLKYDGKKKV